MAEQLSDTFYHKPFGKSGHNVSVALNEKTNPFRWDWQIEGTRIGGYAPTEALAKAIGIAAVEEIGIDEEGEPFEFLDPSNVEVAVSWCYAGGENPCEVVAELDVKQAQEECYKEWCLEHDYSEDQIFEIRQAIAITIALAQKGIVPDGVGDVEPCKAWPEAISSKKWTLTIYRATGYPFGQDPVTEKERIISIGFVAKNLEAAQAYVDRKMQANNSAFGGWQPVSPDTIHTGLFPSPKENCPWECLKEGVTHQRRYTLWSNRDHRMTVVLSKKG